MDIPTIREIFNSKLTKNQKIAKLISLGYSRREIMNLLGCGPTIITTVRRSLELTGSPPQQAKIGRPTKKTPEVGAYIVQQTKVDPYISGTELSHHVSSSMNMKISNTTLNTFRNEIGYQYLPPIKEPLISEIQIQKRLNFCYTILIHSKELPNICFSHESRFFLGSQKSHFFTQVLNQINFIYKSFFRDRSLYNCKRNRVSKKWNIYWSSEKSLFY